MQLYIFLEKFLNQYGISLEGSSYISDKLKNKNIQLEFIDDDISIFSKILTDTYNLNAKDVKIISGSLNKKGIILGRMEKQILKKYLDYNNNEDLIRLSQIVNIDSQVLNDIININCNDHSKEAIECFITAWNEAKKKMIL